MKVLQSYYTSCRVGQSGASGFQFYSFSDGLTNEELLEIEKIGNYMAPLNLPSNPTIEEIISLFPISFNYFKLKSGRVGVLQSVPLSQDFSGRPGNFFSHAFILESDNFPFFPILLYESNSFRKNLNDDEWNTENVPSKLPILEIETLENNPNFNLNSIQHFLSINENEYLYSQILNSIIEKSLTNRRIILTDNQINIALWLLSISFAFPLYLANDITFSTYSFDPSNNNSLICATSKEGNRFNFYNEAAYQYQYYIFNTMINKYSEIKISSLYAEIANTALTVSYEKFLKFHDFFNNFNYNTINNKIDIIYKIFTVNEEKTQFQPDWQEILEFINQYANENYIREFLSIYTEFLEKVLSNIILDNVPTKIFFSQILTIVKRTKSINDYKITFDLYLTWLNMIVFCNEGENANEVYMQRILSCNEMIVGQYLVFDNYFISNYFSNETLNSLYNYLSDTEISSFFTYLLAIIFQNVQLCKYSFDRIFENPSFLLMVKQYGKLRDHCDGLKLLLSSIYDIALYSFILDKFSPYLTANNLLSIVQSSDKNTIKPEELFRFIKIKGNIELLIVLMPYYFANTFNKSTCFWDLVEYFKSKQLSSHHYEILIGSYLNNIKLIKNEIPDLTHFAVQKDCINILPELIEAFESTISFNFPRNEDFSFVSEVILIKGKYKISTKNNITELYNLLIDLKSNKLHDVLIVLGKINTDLNKLSIEKLTPFISAFFSYLIPLVSREKDFHNIFAFISIIKYNNTLTIFHSEMLNYLNKNKKTSIINVLIEYYLGIDQYYLETDINERNKIEKFIVAVLLKLDDSALNNLNETYSKKKHSNIKKWEFIWSKIAEQKDNYFSNRLNKYFNSIFKR